MHNEAEVYAASELEQVAASTIGLHVAYDPLSLRVSKEHGWIP